MKINSEEGPIEIKQAYIRVSDIGDNTPKIYWDPEIVGVLPRCRKTRIISTHKMSSNRVWLKPLYSQHGDATVSSKDFVDFLLTLPIKSSRFSPVDVTTELKDFIREDIKQFYRS